MKKLVLIVITFVLLFNLTFYASAAEKAVVSSDTESIKKAATAAVKRTIATVALCMLPTMITIMGFKITIDYSENMLDVVSVTRGELTDTGNFNDNVGKNKGEFSVVWNSTENVTEDGSLFVIALSATDKMLGETEISVSYSQEDTFNEKYEDVLLDCKTIKIMLNDSDLQNVLKREADNTDGKTKKERRARDD